MINSSSSIWRLNDYTEAIKDKSTACCCSFFFSCLHPLSSVLAGQISRYLPALPTLPSHGHLILLWDLTWGLNLKAISPRKNGLAVVAWLSCSIRRGTEGVFYFNFSYFSLSDSGMLGPRRTVVNMVVIPGGEGLCKMYCFSRVTSPFEPGRACLGTFCGKRLHAVLCL